MNNLVIMLDLDGCLKTDHNATGPFEVPSLHVVSGSKTYTFGIRPYLDDFLTAAKDKATLYLGTLGGGGYARRVIKAMDIDHYFDGIISAENFRDGMSCFSKFGNAIYIDNDAEVARLKIEKIQRGYALRNHVSSGKQDMWIIDSCH